MDKLVKKVGIAKCKQKNNCLIFENVDLFFKKEQKISLIFRL